MKRLNNWIRQTSQLPTNPCDIVESFSCNSASEECMSLKCHECESNQADEIIPHATDKKKDKVVFHEWKKVDDRAQKVAETIDKKETMSRFNNYVKTLKRSIFVKRIQNTKFNSLQANLKCNEVLIQVDYSENYGNKDQLQIQSAYFGRQNFSIFAVCCYLEIDGVLVNGNIE